MKTTKSKKTVVTPVSELATKEQSRAYLRIKDYLEKHNTELDPNTRSHFDSFYLGGSTVVMEINDQIIATNSRGTGSWDELFINSKGECSTGMCFFGGF